MVQFETEVLDVIQRTHNVKSFRFKKEKGAEFKAGQFFFVTIKINGKERTKHFSFSNSPTETDYLEFTKKLTDSDYSKTLNQLKVGDWAKLKMPYGSFTFEGECEKVAFLCGGIGITPIRSICKYAVDNKLDTDLVLLYGNHTMKDIVFKEDFDIMQREFPKLKVMHILSETGVEWQERKGHIDSQVIKKEVPDYSERKFYICGPPGMVEAMKNVLSGELNVDEKNIIIENFTGY
jgi:ferredoxin-NADP reductase